MPTMLALGWGLLMLGGVHGIQVTIDELKSATCSLVAGSTGTARATTDGKLEFFDFPEDQYNPTVLRCDILLPYTFVGVSGQYVVNKVDPITSANSDPDNNAVITNWGDQTTGHAGTFALGTPSTIVDAGSQQGRVAASGSVGGQLTITVEQRTVSPSTVLRFEMCQSAGHEDFTLQSIAIQLDLPPVDCVGSWSSYGSCTKLCGVGAEERTYSITTATVGGGGSCSYTNGATQTQGCNTDACPESGCGGISIVGGSYTVKTFGTVTVDSECNIDFGGGYLAVAPGPVDSGSNSFTIEAKVNSNMADGYDIIFDSDTYRFGYENGGSKLYSWKYVGGYTARGGVQANQWIHVAVVYDKTAGTIVHYVNGVAETAFSGSVSTPSGAFSIGAGSDANDFNDIDVTSSIVHHFTGKMEHIRQYASALSATDIASLSNGQNVAGATWELSVQSGSGVAPSGYTITPNLSAGTCGTLRLSAAPNAPTPADSPSPADTAVPDDTPAPDETPAPDATPSADGYTFYMNFCVNEAGADIHQTGTAGGDASLSACTELCTQSSTCHGVEWYPSGKPGNFPKCNLMLGSVSSHHGYAGSQFYSATCYVKDIVEPTATPNPTVTADPTATPADTPLPEDTPAPLSTPAPVTTYQWYRADDANAGGSAAIAEATESTYDPVSADGGKYLFLQITEPGNSPTIVKGLFIALTSCASGEASGTTFSKRLQVDSSRLEGRSRQRHRV